MQNTTREVLSELEALARGPYRTTHGLDGIHARRRRLHAVVTGCAATHDEQRIVLRAGTGEIAIELARRGRYGLSHGDARLTAPDRHFGAGFVAQVARWLGTPLAPATAATPTRPEPVAGKYARLGSQSDPLGIDWETYELFIGDPSAAGDDAEVLLRVAHGKAMLVEKSPRDRERLVRLLSRTLGDGRMPERRLTLLTPDRHARIAVPTAWRVAAMREGQLRITDGSESCCLEATALSLPGGGALLPPLADRLHATLVGRGLDAGRIPITTRDRGDISIAWAEHAYDSEDEDRGGFRHARARWLFAANDHVQAMITFQYWLDDKAWAVAEWERIVDTLELANRRVHGAMPV